MHAFQKRHCTVYLRPAEELKEMEPENVIALTVIEKMQPDGYMKENVSTLQSFSTIEIQWYHSSTLKAGVLGPYNVVFLTPTFEKSSSSWIEKILAPVLVISSSIIIVYLFFTVRS